MSDSFSSKQELCDYMDDNMEEYNFRGQPQEFLPQSALNAATERAVIQQIVAQDNQTILNNRDYALLVDRAYRHGRRLFATCVYAAQPMSFLKAMLDNGLTDANLPLGKDDFGVSLVKQRALIRSFMEHQKYFHTIFLAEGSLQNLDDRLSKWFSIPIDYEETAANFKGKGAFGAVYKVKIHGDHRSFRCNTNDNDEFAMKVTQHEGREQSYHLAMAGLKHPHLVKCLASFTLGAKYQMVYELANCDLEDFMETRNHSARISGEGARWLAQQLAGLASALDVVHNPNGTQAPATASTLNVPQINPRKTGYIHDIKPDNILVFTYPGSRYRLCLSDFSCARVVECISGKRDSYKTGTRSGAPMYRAPETYEGPTSRPYDIWSLGCLYLELAAWFVEGYEGLEVFRESRERRTHNSIDSIIDEGFCFETDTGHYQLRDAVVAKIDHLSKTCTGDLKDIVDVIPALLKINPKHRLTASQLADKLKHLNTDTDSGIGMNQPGTLSVPSFASSHSLADDSDSDFDGLIKVTRPSNE